METWDRSARAAAADRARSGDTPVTLDVVGPQDDRVPVPSPDAYPWTAFCRLVIDFGSHREFGTGWITSQHTVATAAHCIYSRQAGAYARGIEVWRQRRGDADTGERLTTSGFDVARGWTEHPRPESAFRFDYGVVFVEDAGGAVPADHLRPTAAGDGELEQADSWIAGFPLSRQGRLVYAGQSGLQVSATSLAYRIDTSRGQSGAPVLVWDDGAKRFLPVGIHSQGTEGGNFAVRIRPAVVELYAGWEANPA